MIPERDRVSAAARAGRDPAGAPVEPSPVIGAGCAAAGGGGLRDSGAANPKQFFFSWLVSFLFFLSLTLGALFFVLIQYAVSGRMGDRAAADRGDDLRHAAGDGGPLPAGVPRPARSLFWTVPGAAEHDALLRWKAPYLNVPFFLIRAALYFAIWSFIALVYYRGSRGQDATGAPGVSARLRRSRRARHHRPRADPDLRLDRLDHVAHAALVLDHLRRLFLRGFVRGVHRAFCRSSRWRCGAAGLLDTVISTEHLHDVGKLLFAFTAFWAYIAFSQFFLMWYGNLPEETIWYKARIEGSWMIGLAAPHGGHFVAPFFYLMGRTVKRKGATLAVGGAWILAMHFVDLYWQVMPTLHPEGLRPSVLDVAALVGRRRVLRGGGELADATAGARSSARPEARRIAGLRERLSRSGPAAPTSLR